MIWDRLPRSAGYWPSYRRPGEREVSTFAPSQPTPEEADAGPALEEQPAIVAPDSDVIPTARELGASLTRGAVPAANARTQFHEASPWKGQIQASVDKAKRRKADKTRPDLVAITLKIPARRAG